MILPSPCPDRPAALRSPLASRPVPWSIALFGKMQAKVIDKFVAASDAEIAAMQRPVPDNRMSRAIFGGLAAGVAVRDERLALAGRTLDVRIFEPAGRARPGRALLYMHGGGWTLGDIGMTSWVCSGLAARTGMLVASLGYRLAPAHRFPAAVEDCYDALDWLHRQSGALGIDPARVGVAGESAGGNLAAATCLLSRERGGPAVDFQTLIYPALDLGWTSPSLAENAVGPILTPAAMRKFRACYLGPQGDAADPLVSPLRADDLAGLPPALILTGERDPIRDDGWRYAARLRAAGVRVRISEYAGGVHGFLNFPGLNPGTARRALDEIAIYHGGQV